MRSILFYIAGIYFSITTLSAQVKVVMINDTLTSERLVKQFFLGKGIQVSNIRYRGEADALGAFTDSAKSTGFDKGIVISTGRVELLQGKNTRPNTGSNFGGYFFTDDDLVTKSNMCDGAVLEFDFVSVYDSMVFRFIFGSEEYPEFVGKNFNDVFAFYLSPKESRHVKPRNIGTLPGGATVMINNVNHKKNSEWYIANDKYDDPFYDVLEYDGFTKPVVAASRVIPFQPYHLKIIIADLEDCDYDSGVLLEAGSFNSYSTRKPKPSKRNYYFKFQSESHLLEKTELIKVRHIADSLLKFKFDSIVITGHTDSTGDENRNRQLSLNRAATIAQLLKDAGIKEELISVHGKGSGSPLKTNTTEKGRAANRRVEMIFYRK